MSFLNPLFLFGLLAAAVPIVIHLFTRRRPREREFPSLEFLTEVNQSEIRRLKLKQWLLLALRTLAVAALALAMSRPALHGSAGAARAATTVVALVDQSGSMGAISGEGTLLAEARRVLESLFTTLGPADELLLVPYDDAPRPLSPRPLSDLTRLRGAVQGLEPTARTTDHRRALDLAAAALTESPSLNRELYWISDFQAAGFASAARSGEAAAASDAAQPGLPALPRQPWDRVRSYLVPLAPTNRANASLTDASLAPTDNGAALAVSARAFGTPAGDLAVEVLEVGSGAQLGRGFVAMPERGDASAWVPMTRLPDPAGEARLPDDALPLDNRRLFAAGRAGTLRVVLRETGDPSALRLALAAGSPASGLAVDAVGPDALAARLADADVLVLNDLERLSATELQATLDYHRAGGAVLVVLGSRADATFWNDNVLGEFALGTLGAGESAAPGAAWRLRVAAAGHPALGGFPARPGEPLSSAQFGTIGRLAPRPGARTILEFDRAHPALVEAPHAMAFVASLAPAASDFPVSGAFLPLFHQVVKVLARGSAAAALAPGDRYAMRAGTGDWRIEDEDGRTLPAELIARAGATRLVSAPLERTGLYRVLEGGASRTTFVVNADARESDLAAVPEAALANAFPRGRAQILRPGADLARRVREARYGRELWSWFVIAALALLIAETVVARWGMPGASRPPRSPGAILPAS